MWYSAQALRIRQESRTHKRRKEWMSVMLYELWAKATRKNFCSSQESQMKLRQHDNTQQGVMQTHNPASLYFSIILSTSGQTCLNSSNSSHFLDLFQYGSPWNKARPAIAVTRALASHSCCLRTRGSQLEFVIESFNNENSSEHRATKHPQELDWN